ncbi:MAG: hypothetical protein UGF45_08900 [Massilioclostridium sp.]|nr:hypothetical protein [Massilioclostridium sp.]
MESQRRTPTTAGCLHILYSNTANAAAKEYGGSGAFFLTITDLRPGYLFWRSAVLSQSPTEVEAKSEIYQPNIGLSPDCLLFLIDL